MSLEIELFVVGVLITIPVSLVVNLLTPALRDWIASYSKARSAKRIAELREQAGRVPPPFEWTICRVLMHGAGALWCLCFAATMIGIAIPEPGESLPTGMLLRVTLTIPAIAGSGFAVRAFAVARNYARGLPDVAVGPQRMIDGFNRRINRLEQKLAKTEAK